MKGSLRYKIIPSLRYDLCDPFSSVIFTLVELSLTVVDFCSQSEFPSTEDLNLSLYLILPTLEKVIARFNSTCVSSCGIINIYTYCDKINQLQQNKLLFSW